VKLEFFKRPPTDQAVILREVAARRGLSAVMVEKDFWVSWTLAGCLRTRSSANNWWSKGGHRRVVVGEVKNLKKKSKNLK
jgi:hypothetical protein